MTLELSDLSTEFRGLVSDLEGWLSNGMDSEELRKKLRTGETIIKASIGGGSNMVNVIPGGISGTCHQSLVVAVGADDSGLVLENRLLEALKHLAIDCRGRTGSVLFIAAWWDATRWARHRASFKKLGIPCALLMPFIPPQILK